MSGPRGAHDPERSELDAIGALQRSGLFEGTWFIGRNPDLLAASIDPLTHFHRWGWREGRWPNPYFDPAWYVRQYRDVRTSGENPLLHYIEHGEAEGRQPVAWFDPQWYRAHHRVPDGLLCLTHFLERRQTGTVSPVPEFDAGHYLRSAPDVAAAGMDPFEHYLMQGAHEDRSPSAGFDPRLYRARYLQHLPHANPLLHYRQHRQELGVFPAQRQERPGIAQEVRRNSQPGPLFEPPSPLAAAVPRRAKLLAFYLPQFHPVPENDAWWGTGFTEWTNVARAVPRFAGHYQPRIPRDLGHYRLDDPAVLRQQMELARGAGVHGFVYYFYWFNGRRLLHRPVDIVLADPSLSLPFCLMWANENWTRRWDGGEGDVLLAQDYREVDEPALAAELVRHFADPRYIRLDGRPLLMVYRAGLVPHTAATVARWRRLFAALGESPFLVMAQSFEERDPRPFGLDAAVEFPPHKLVEGLPLLNAGLHMLDEAATAEVYSYASLAKGADLAPSPFPLIRTVLPGWDNDARRQGAGMVLHGSTPALYQEWLDQVVGAAAAQTVGGEALVCVNAWNEWAEGAYLEPDVHFGAAYLNATARAVAGAAATPTRLLLVGHDAFPAGSQLLLLHLGRHLRRVRGMEVAFLLLGGGALAGEYRAVAPTTVLPDAAGLHRFAEAAPAQGFHAAIVNTSAAGWACAQLTQAGLHCTLLVHELPRLLREKGLVESARAGAAAAAHVVFAASYVQDRFHELVAVPPGRGVVLPQGAYQDVDGVRPARREALRLPDGAVLALGLGYADLRKGFDLFLHAWRVAHMADPAVHFLWVGDIDPSVHAYLGAEMAAAAASGTFHHLGWQADGAGWFAAADVHLLTSREDPFPSVVLEAMRAGVPTVAFEEGGGAPDVLRDHRAGTAVALGDVAEMVRQARALALQTRPEDRERLRRAAALHFGFEAYADRLLGLALPGLPLASVAVPTFNYAQYLPGRLRSILAQTCPVAEVLILDDASTDGSEAVVRAEAEAAGRLLRWVPAGRNPGSVFRQWRRAAEMARGEWLWIAEADDLAEPGLLQALCDAVRQAPDAVLAFCDSRAVDAAGDPLWPDHTAYYQEANAPSLLQSGTIPAGRFLRECLAERNLILNVSAVLWRRTALLQALDRCGRELDGFRLAGDWRLYAEALAQGGSVAYVAQPLNVHRRHAASVTHALPPAQHLAEVRQMQRHMRGVLGDAPGLAEGQRRAMAAIRRAVRAARQPAPGATAGAARDAAPTGAARRRDAP